MDVVETTGPNYVILSTALGIGSCAWSVLLLYNLVTLVSFLREKTEDKASGLSKAAWAVGFLSAPACVGPCSVFLAIVALVMASMEKSRIYEDKSTLASMTPARMATVNGAVNIVLFLAVVAGSVASVYL